MEPLCIPFSLSSSDLFLIANKFLCVPCKNPEILKIKGQFSFSSSSLPQAKETNKTNSSFVFLFLHQTVELPSTQVLSTCAPTGASRSFPKLFLWPLPTCPSLYQLRPSSLCFSSGVTPAGNVPGIPQPKQSSYLYVPMMLYFPYHSSYHEDCHCFKHSLPFDKTIFIGGCCIQLSA